MPPNVNEGIVQIAHLYNKTTYQKGGPILEEPSAEYYTGNSAQQDVDDDDGSTVRVTTRARFTYMLDSFEKHAMLIINNSHVNIADVSMTIQCAHAFNHHNFDYTIIGTESDSKQEIWQQIEKFFHQDFSSIGAVAVATLSCDNKIPIERDNYIAEWDVLNYFITNQPSSLREKLKIFISEAVEPSSPPAIASLPSDILILQAKNDNYMGYRCERPLSLLCHKLLWMKEQRDVFDILSEISYTTGRASPRPTPIRCTDTLTKQLMFYNCNPWAAKFVSPPYRTC